MFESFFISNGKFHQQCDGVAVYSPLGPTSGYVHMYCFENISLENCPPHLKPIVYNRQFIDIFLLFWSKNHAKKFKNYHNKEHKNMEFKLVLSVYCSGIFKNL